MHDPHDPNQGDPAASPDGARSPSGGAHEPAGAGSTPHEDLPPTQETEIKILLPDSRAYDRLAAGLAGFRGAVLQENVFLDTPDRALAAHRLVLRLRREEPVAHGPVRILLALKGPSRRMGEALHRLDVESEVPARLWGLAQAGPVPTSSLRGPAIDHLRSRRILPHVVERFLGFRNHRSVYELPLGGAPRQLLLDRTTFTGGAVDHEIEVEIASPAPADDLTLAQAVRQVAQDLHELLADHGITPAPPRSGKFSRALREAGSKE